MHPAEALLIPLGKLLRNRHADEAAGLAARPEFATTGSIELTSPAFRDGAEIPARHCGRLIGDNVSPPLDWDALPAGTMALVLLVEDLDVPAAVPGLHLIAQFAPREGGLPEGALNLGADGVEFLPNHRGVSGYAGPRPLPGHGPHRYVFHLFALDARLDLVKVADRANLPPAVAGHVLAAGRLTGTRLS
jgi:Raf kinase inhibitor-like YbhB/YbcL family protein